VNQSLPGKSLVCPESGYRSRVYRQSLAAELLAPYQPSSRLVRHPGLPASRTDLTAQPQEGINRDPFLRLNQSPIWFSPMGHTAGPPLAVLRLCQGRRSLALNVSRLQLSAELTPFTPTQLNLFTHTIISQLSIGAPARSQPIRIGTMRQVRREPSVVGWGRVACAGINILSRGATLGDPFQTR
jgi:hypothetical protein